jgi:AcrR family transcriptional regulator
MPRLKLTVRKLPRQKRSVMMVETILQAAARVLARESLDGFNTNRVAEVAGISVGSLYQYFPNKSALVAALIDRDHAALATGLERLLEGSPSCTLRATLAAIAELLIEQQYGDPIYAAAIDHEERRLPLGARAQESDARFAAIASAFLGRHRAEISANLPSSAPRDLVVIARALVDADALAGGPPGADLKERVVRALYGYLTD